MKIINIDVADKINIVNIEDTESKTIKFLDSILSIPADNYNNILLNFNFISPDATKDGLHLFAIFSADFLDKPIEVEITELEVDGKFYKTACFIPAETLTKIGNVTLGIYGYVLNTDGSLNKRVSLTPIIYSVNTGSYREDAEEGIIPTPTAFEVYFDKVANMANVYASKNELNRVTKSLQNNIDNSNTTLQNNIDNEANTRKSSDSNLQSQINSLASGSPLVASSISEMTDTSRVYVNTSDGNWYYYNGSAWVSGGIYQATEIPNDSITTNKIKDKNVTYDKLSFIKNTIIKNIHNPENILSEGKCWHYATGNETVISGYFGTKKYEIDNNKIFFTNAKQAIFFDSENKFLKTISQTGFTFICNYDNHKKGVFSVDVPNGAKYFGLNYGNGETDIVISFEPFNSYIEPGILSLEMEEKDKELINDVLGNDPNLLTRLSEKMLRTNDLKMNCIGDSITYGYTPFSGQQMKKPYPLLLKELLNLSECRNYGISGSRLVPYNNLYNPVVERYLEMDDDADIISVFIGTNDYEGNSGGNWGSALGAINDTENTTFYGCLNILCDGLITKYPDKFIFFITPIHREGDNLPNARGVYLSQYVNAIKEICEKFGIPVLDAYSKSGIYPSNETQKVLLVNDGLHPNQICQETKIAPMITSFIKSNFYNY